jgi:molecular chaperone DnaJ
MDLVSAYETLGVPIGAEAIVVRAAYRRLVAFWHPDKNSASEALSRTQALNRAIQVLETAGFPTTVRADAADGTRDSDAAAYGHDDPFSRYYSDFRRHGGFDDASEAPQARRGRSIHRKVKLTVEQAAFGATVELTGRVKDNCAACQGRGWTTRVKCPECAGSGYVYSRSRRSYYGYYEDRQARCSRCAGDGTVGRLCSTCSGTGNDPVSRNYTTSVRIPPGVVDDDRLVIRGAGGRSTSAAGDFNIRIELLPHELYTFDPEDGYLCITVPVHVLQFLTLDDIVIPTLWGDRVIVPDPPKRVVEIPQAGFPGRHGERFPLRVRFEVIDSPLPEPFRTTTRELWSRMNRVGAGRDARVEHWLAQLRALRKRTGRDA